MDHDGWLKIDKPSVKQFNYRQEKSFKNEQCVIRCIDARSRVACFQDRSLLHMGAFYIFTLGHLFSPHTFSKYWQLWLFMNHFVLPVTVSIWKKLETRKCDTWVCIISNIKLVNYNLMILFQTLILNLNP